MATTYLSPQQLKDFAQKVDEVAKKFPAEVVRIRHSFSRDWDGDPAIYFRILLDRKSTKRPPPLGAYRTYRKHTIDDLALYEQFSEYIPYFSYRTETEQDELKDPEWE